MITIQSTVHVAGTRAAEILDFLLRCEDADYQRWWPGTHFHMHTIRRRPDGVGNTVSMDEMIGQRRVKLTGVVTELIPGKRLVWQLKALVRLPVRLVLELEDDPTGVRVTHTIRAGLGGVGRIFDPLFRLYLSRGFERAMEQHVHTEFPRLGALLGHPSA
jgi:hypothetical protein